MSQRSLLSYHVEDRVGNSVQNAKVFVYEVGTSTPVTDLYTAMTGGSPVGYLISDAAGTVSGWVDEARYFTLSVTDNGDTAFYPWDAGVLKSWTTFSVIRGAFLVSDLY